MGYALYMLNTKSILPNHQFCLLDAIFKPNDSILGKLMAAILEIVFKWSEQFVFV